MISFYFQTSLKISYKYCSCGNMHIGGEGVEGKKTLEVLHCDCKVSPSGRTKKLRMGHLIISVIKSSGMTLIHSLLTLGANQKETKGLNMSQT